MTKILNIIRGPSGSGKSSFLKSTGVYEFINPTTGEAVPYNPNLLFSNQLVFQDNICSSDFYHYRIEPKLDVPFYDFKIENISETHNLCFSKFLNCIKNGLEKIYIDNTNIKKWHYENYITVAEMHGYKVSIFEFYINSIKDLRTIIDRNQHGLDQSIITRMVLDFESDDRAEKMSIEQ